MASPPRDCADGWTIVVHPDGWRYFYSPGIITDNLELVQQSPSESTFHRQLDGEEYEEHFTLSSSGNKPEKVYVNHSLAYASYFPEEVHHLHRPSPNTGQIYFPNDLNLLAILIHII
jgi:hypothetical protein